MASERRGRVALGGLPASVARARAAIERGVLDDPSRLDRLLGYDASEVCARLVTPALAARAVAEAAIVGVRSVDEATEVLVARGLLEDDWIEHRRWLGDDERSAMRALVAIAADASAAMTVERLAVEAMARAERAAGFGGVFRWRAANSWVDATSAERPFGEGRRARPRSATLVAIDALLQPLATRAPSDAMDTWVDAFATDVRRHWSWALSGREPARNPFTPLCAAWMLGYAIERVSDDEIALCVCVREAQESSAR